jgi:hypothetical protein
MPNIDEEVKRLAALAHAKQVKSYALDEIVYEVASSIPQHINNEGFEAQIRFILTHDGIEEGAKTVESAFTEDND